MTPRRDSPRRLSDSPDFADVVRAADDDHGILPDLVLKEYWVTRVLRAIASDPEQRGRVLFKGGTSLPKGWKLIDRFSEDVDLLLTGPEFGEPPTGKGERERHFKAIRTRIEAETPLRLPDRASLSCEEWDFHYIRSNYHCDIRYPLPDREAARSETNLNWLLVEMGYRGGATPHETRPLTSMIAEFLETVRCSRRPSRLR